MGAKILAGLPEKNSLTPEYVEEFLEAPRDLVAVVVLRPKKKDVDLENDEAEETVVFRIAALEHIEGAEGHALLEQLRARHRDRTGEHVLPGMDQLPADDIPGSSTGDSEETVRQLDLLRQERASQLREKAEVADDKETADQLEADADAFEAGWRDEELRGQLEPAFSDAAPEPVAVG